MKNETMKGKEVIAALVTASGWCSILVSIAFFLLFLRVEFEPGASKMPSLLWAGATFCSFGGLAFLLGMIYLIGRQAKKALLVAGLLCLALIFGAILLSPILLIFMV